MTEPGPRFLVAIPVYNEEKYCCRVVRRTEQYAGDILVVNDGSTDRTPQMIQRFSSVKVVSHSTNQGYGQALITAFQYAVENAYDYCLTMDCDEQHEPEAIPEFIDEMPKYDIVSGSRYLFEFPDDTPAPAERRRVNAEITRIMNALTGYRLTDAFCGQKAYKVSALKRMTITERGYAMPLELWIEAAAAGLTVKEIAVRRIYKDFSRTFGPQLNDATVRLRHYLDVLERTARRVGLDTKGIIEAERQRIADCGLRIAD